MEEGSTQVMKAVAGVEVEAGVVVVVGFDNNRVATGRDGYYIGDYH